MQSVSLFCCVLFLAFNANSSSAGIPAFPGAEGFGANTPGGRHGKVRFVTNLNDSGPGSLRAACDAQGPRIVIFRVAGIIDLKREIKISNPFLTLAAQTAPGDGICLRNYELEVRAHDVIIRYLRSRPGIASGKEEDAIGVGSGSYNVIVDHCSATWAVDENLSPSGSISNVTVQWCLIAEGLNNSIHHKGAHGYGSLVRAIGGLSLHHNLWAHNSSRNPRLGDNYSKGPSPTFDCRYNVMYNYGDICSGMTGDRLFVNYVGNYIRPGPNSDLKRGIIVFTDTADAAYYVRDNVVEGNQAVTRNNSLLFDRTEFEGKKLVHAVKKPFAAAALKTSSAPKAFEAVLRDVGATLPRRDNVDVRIVQTVLHRNGQIIDSTDQVGSWPEYKTGPAPMDSDNDGIPDDWEIKHHLNPTDPSDANMERRDGYTNIERYINGIASSR